MSPIKQLIHRLFRRTPDRVPPLLTLPIEVLFDIVDYLDVIDQACLALTCKPLFFIFSSVLQQQVFRFPRLCQFSIPGLPPDSPDAVRRQLLLRLQNSKWGYCSSCLKLHPMKDFELAATRPGPMENREAYCHQLAGVVDLYPCVSLTHRDKMRVIRYLRLYPHGKLTDILPLGLLRSLTPTTCGGQPALHHKCDTHYHGHHMARVDTTLYISEKTLIASVEYNLAIREPSPVYFRTIFPDTNYNIVSFVVDAEAQRLHDEDRSYDADISAYFTPGFKTLKGTRNLGRYDLPADKFWFWQSRLENRTFWQLEGAYKEYQDVRSNLSAS